MEKIKEIIIIIIIIINLLIILNFISCKGSKMEKEEKKEFLNYMNEQLKGKYNLYEKKMRDSIKKIIEENKEIPIKKCRKISEELTKDEKNIINKEYKKYEVIYKGRLDTLKKIIIIGMLYNINIESSMKWGVIYEVKKKDKLEKIAKFDNKGIFFIKNNISDVNDKDKYFYIITLNSNINIIKIERYSTSFAYGIGYELWYNKESNRWKWRMINTWF